MSFLLSGGGLALSPRVFPQTPFPLPLSRFISTERKKERSTATVHGDFSFLLSFIKE